MLQYVNMAIKAASKPESMVILTQEILDRVCALDLSACSKKRAYKNTSEETSIMDGPLKKRIKVQH